MKLRNGVVRWFDKLSGEGMIRLCDTQESVYVHYSAIDGARQGKRVNLEDGHAVVCTVLIDSTIKQVLWVKQVA